MTTERTRCHSNFLTAIRVVVVLLAGLVCVSALVAGAVGTAYRIGPGDIVDVQVWRETDLSGPHKVDSEGTLRHVLAGAVPAGGMTAEELAEELRIRLERDYLREARVMVSVKTSARRRAWVLGAVDEPGPYPLPGEPRLLDLVFAAGGVAADSDGRAVLYRMGEPGAGDAMPAPGEGTPLAEFEVDLAALLAGNLSANLEVQAGDVLVVSSEGGPAQSMAPRRVRIVGEVERPGSYDLRQAPTVLDAVLAAGGFTEYASSNRARLVRGEGEERSVRKLRLGDIVHGRDGSENVSLESGDLIVVPESFF
ncbi:MAG: polysaccharide biosynthesis/export family protein [Myxococcota bacterium]